MDKVSNMSDKKVMDEDSVEEYDEIAEEIFSPIYPVIVEQIIGKCHITTGTCLDIGCCGGHLGIAMAQATNLRMILMDQLEKALQLADARIILKGLQSGMRTLLGDVHQIPLPNDSIQLVISRGSVPFWQDKTLAYKEIYRVLSPGGAAYIGGGFGNEVLKDRITELMKEKDPSWRRDKKNASPEEHCQEIEERMREADIEVYEAISNGSGNWLYFRKDSKS